MEYNMLFSPVTINALTLKNRIVMSSMVTQYAASNGEVTDQMIHYYAERARGGVGLIMIEATYVERQGDSYKFGLGADTDEMLPGLARLANAIHACGGKVGLQLQHAGRTANPLTNGGPIKLVSYIPGVTPYEGARVLTREDIADLVKRYAEAALRAKKAGFDLVELHGAHGYLLNQFLSPFTNLREDEYGGSAENRLRFPLEVLSACREAVGKDFPLTVRLSVDEFNGTGLTLQTSLPIAQAFVDNGIDALNISVGACETNRYTIPPAVLPEGFNADRAAAVRKAVEARVPVAVAGRIHNAALAESILTAGKADIIVMGRPLIADPYLPVKSQAGRLDDVAPCLSCNEGCVGIPFGNVTCAVNPRAGQEARFPHIKTNTPKRIVVIGAGPAGIQAALTAREKGHHVTLIEREKTLGGLLHVACRPPHKEAFEKLRRYMEHAVRQSGMEVRLGTEADVDMIRALNPDMTVVATGSEPVVPGFCRNTGAVTAQEVLLGRETGQNVLILGGGLVGCETAEMLAEQGKKVTILELRDTLAPDMEKRTRIFMMARLKELDVHALLNTEVLEVSGLHVRVRGPLRTERSLDEFDSLVMAFGYRSRNLLQQQLAEAGIPFTAAGDCVRPSKVITAVRQGFQAAWPL
ncbi:FAD-dependent oxidoreductase [uncultured Mailhella sp.]|uniref:oxidoreductase n=1 Tax=uncultured Mailhella sp. TaxID=1981031 RepID=UPI00320A927E